MTRIWLFLSSLAPAFLVVGIRIMGTECFWGGIVVVIGVVLFPVVYLVFKTRQSVTPKPFVVKEFRDESYQVPTYLLIFIFPFLFIDIEDAWTAGAYGVLILFVALLLIRSELSLVNPALLIIGYHIYTVQAEGGEEMFLISKIRPRVAGRMSATPLSGNIYLTHVRETERMNG